MASLSFPDVSKVQRLGRNHGGYLGDRIDIAVTLAAIIASGTRHGWQMESMPAADGLELLAMQRCVAEPKRRIYLSSGVHGDEPAGPLAMQQLLEVNIWPPDADIWLCPCLNPRGLERNTRGNADGIDLNRDYRETSSAEVRVHKQWLERQPAFDLALCLHEDWEAHGFYVYEISADDRESIAHRIVTAVAPVCPIDRSSEIDGWPAREGVIIPHANFDERPLWPEALYLRRTKTRHTCTLEAPSDFALELRVAALVTGVGAALGGRT